jgi:hypothetical protein
VSRSEKQEAMLLGKLSKKDENSIVNHVGIKPDLLKNLTQQKVRELKTIQNLNTRGAATTRQNAGASWDQNTTHVMKMLILSLSALLN